MCVFFDFQQFKTLTKIAQFFLIKLYFILKLHLLQLRKLSHKQLIKSFFFHKTNYNAYCLNSNILAKTVLQDTS